MWLFLVILVAALPPTLLLRDLTAGRLRSALTLRPAVLALTVSTAAAAATGLSVVTGLTASITTAHHDASNLVATRRPKARPTQAITSPPATTPVATGPAPTYPGRVLTAGQVSAVLHRVQGSLPSAWTSSPVPKSTPGQDPNVRPSACSRLLTEDAKPDPPGSQRAGLHLESQILGQVLPPAGAIVDLTLISYQDTAFAARTLRILPREAAQCPHWTIQSSVAPSEPRPKVALRSEPDLNIPTPNHRLMKSETWVLEGAPGRGDSARGLLRIGHNYASVSVTYGHYAATTPAARISLIQNLRDTLMKETLAALNQVS